jgi:hypothetical protein
MLIKHCVDENFKLTKDWHSLCSFLCNHHHSLMFPPGLVILQQKCSLNPTSASFSCRVLSSFQGCITFYLLHWQRHSKEQGIMDKPSIYAHNHQSDWNKCLLDACAEVKNKRVTHLLMLLNEFPLYLCSHFPYSLFVHILSFDLSTCHILFQ